MKFNPGLVLASLAVLLAIPAEAAAEIRASFGFRIGAGRPHYRRAYPYRPVYYPVHPLRPATVRVVRVNYGRVDFNVKPQRSRIYVDGHYLGIADDFNGYPQTAKLPVGYHNIRVVAPDGTTERRRIYVVAGEELNFNLKF